MEYLYKSAILLTILLAFYKVFLERLSFFQTNRWFLLLGLFLTFTIPLWKIEVVTEVSGLLLDDGVFTGLLTKSNEVDQHLESNINITTLLSWVYWIGFIIMLFRLAIQGFSLFSLYKKLPKNRSKAFLLSETEEVDAAFSFFNWIVINVSSYSKEEQNRMLNHEKVHVLQYHSIDVILLEIVTVVMWFNPFAWLYKKNSINNLEYIADSISNREITDYENYITILLKTATLRSPQSLVNNFNSTLIKKRILMLHKNQNTSVHRWKYLLILPVLLLFVYAFNRVETIKTVAETHSLLESMKINDEIVITVVIDKNTSDAEIEKLKKTFKEQGVDFTVKKLKRNKNDEITGLSIYMKSDESEASFSQSGDKPIPPVHIHYNDKENIISIGNMPPSHPPHPPELMWITEGAEGKGHGKEKHIVKIMKNGEAKHDVMIIKGDENKQEFYEQMKLDVDVEEDGKEKTYIIKINEDLPEGDKEIDKLILKKKLEKKSDSNIFIYEMDEDDKNSETIYKVNGKEMSKEEFEKMDKKDIKEIEIIKKKKQE